MIKKILTILLGTFSTLVGLYPFIYFFINRKFGLLQTKTDILLADTAWNIAFYIHIILGGVALLIGWTQFINKWRRNRMDLHRQIGKLYILCVIPSALASMYIALYATGGIITSIGFLCMGLIWFSTTIIAYSTIRKGRIARHKQMMTYSYAACLAAVTLRIYLPLLIVLFQDFNKAYTLVAWLCWVPNIAVAYYLSEKYKSVDEEIAF